MTNLPEEPPQWFVVGFCVLLGVCALGVVAALLWQAVTA